MCLDAGVVMPVTDAIGPDMMQGPGSVKKILYEMCFNLKDFW